MDEENSQFTYPIDDPDKDVSVARSVSRSPRPIGSRVRARVRWISAAGLPSG
jgi:hypothetical protein